VSEPGGDAAGTSDGSAAAASRPAAPDRLGLGRAASGEAANGAALLGALGGARGIIEAVLPGVVFLVVYVTTSDLTPALVASVGVGVLFALARIVQRQSVLQAVGGLVGTLISAVFSRLTHSASGYYVPGFWIDAVYGGVMLVSALVRWPLIGLAVGYFSGKGASWKADARAFRLMTVITLLWTALFFARLAVQLPLYWSDNVPALAIARLAMGLPLYAPLLVLSWLFVRAAFYGGAPAATRPR
jgi:hypothetical protein